LFKNQKMNIL